MYIYGVIKKKLLFCISVMVIVLASGGIKICASDIPNYKEGEIIVKYKQGSVKPQNSVFFTDACNDMEYIDEEHSYYYIDNSDMEDLLEKCNNDPDIEYAQPNYKYSMKYVTNDPYLAYEWGLNKINVYKVWDLTTKEEETPIIAIVDTGVNADHLDLKGNILKGYNVIDGTTDVKDECGHGTHIAGIAAAITNNETGIAGVSGKSKILPVKVLDGYGNGYSSDIAIGIKWAADKGAKIINLSLGGASYDNYLKEAVEYATNKGCIIVAAAGNKGSHRPTYPAAFENVVAVTAVDNNDKLCNFSNFGKYIDIAAPGLDIYSTSKDGGYEYRSGTSMACAFVSGTMALVWGGAPEKTPREIEEIIKDSAKKVDISEKITYDIGSGVIDAYSAYKLATNKN